MRQVYRSLALQNPLVVRTGNKLESTLFKKKSSIEQDVIFTNPYRNRKSDEYQSLTHNRKWSTSS
ncbi:hypothetical protein MTR_4g051658 [Medicago truncatula]|uniref:Uncharacterized protein n=1 Tax=Medicago truncatula TaxID=3880 RepID=A0A072UL20_MEDTR|nr:hypothetical protein MTR_4g051658 [Medicago truncatula]